MFKEKIVLSKAKNLVGIIREYEREYLDRNQEVLKNRTAELKKEALKGNLDKILPEAFGLCCVAAKKVLGMTPYDVQLIGGIVLHHGNIAEMKTGEGKTLVAIFPVFLNALTGKGVHVITVNDYLAKRDAEQMGQVYKYLGLTTGCIYSGMSQSERKAAYQCDITYGTNSEFGFDYLRDNMAVMKDQLVQRELNYTIIDEVDSILIDESRTPLIISGGGKDSSDIFYQTSNFAKSLKKTTNYNPDRTKMDKALEKEEEPNGDYILVEKTKDIYLTDAGIRKAELFFGVKNYSDPENILLTHYIAQSLRAVYLMQKDVDYLVKDGKIVIVDTSTGRLMESRKYSDNLHQAIEAKENLEISSESKTMATVTYQNFFRLYEKMSGMTGTAATDRDELKKIYNLDVIQVPTNKPCVRIDKPDKLFPSKKDKYEAIVKAVVEYNIQHRPVLIGTTSVEESEIIDKYLTKMMIKHTVLNAKNHEREAEIIAQAGKLNSVTIATNMAGRGTDILLGGNPSFFVKDYIRKNNINEEGNIEITKDELSELTKKYEEECKCEKEEVIKLGGLAVIGTERNDNRRIDDQLIGRAGRQGDPGSSEFFLSTEDKLFRMFGGSIKNQNLSFEYTEKINNKFIKKAQQELENISFASRKNVLEYDDVNDNQRKQVYNIRRQALLSSDEEIVEVFNRYKKLVIEELVNKHSQEEIETFFREKGISSNKEAMLELIKKRMDNNEESLKSIGRDLPSMIRFITLSTIDRNYVKYINQIISLKESVNITVMGSLKPIQLYQVQSIKMFDELINTIKTEIVFGVVNIVVKQPEKVERTVININLD